MEISQLTFLWEQRNDPEVMKIIDSIISDKPYPKYKSYFIHPVTGLLMINRKCLQLENVSYINIIVPKILKHKVLNIFHMPHFGVINTDRKLVKKFKLTGIFQDTKKFAVPPASLQEIFIPSKPSELVSVDFLGPFSNGFLVLTFLDYLSKHLELFLIN